MKILFLSSGKSVPSSRFRIQPFVKQFNNHGHTCAIAHSFPEKYEHYKWIGFRLSQYLKRGTRAWHWLAAYFREFDIIYVEREIFDTDQIDMEIKFRSICQRMVLDIDDAVFLRYPKKFDKLLPMADLVVCGNRFIQDYVRPTNKSSICIPTCIDLDNYTSTVSHSTTTHPVVGWMGTSGNLNNLQVAATALRTVAKEIPFTLQIVVPDIATLQRLDLQGVSIDHRKWTAETEIDLLMKMSVGLMPLLQQDNWNQYKCGAKLLQYLAVGVPGIATPVGINADILDRNLSGILATTTDQWTVALRELLNQPATRQQMGEHGRALVCESYSIQANYPVLEKSLLQLL